MSRRRRSSDPDPRVIGVVAGIVVVLLGLITFGLLTGDDPDEVAIDGRLSATPVTTATEDSDGGDQTAVPADPTDDPNAAPAPAPADPPEPEGPREPTDSDAADFAEVLIGDDMQDAEVVLADLDDDGRNEVVVASILGGQSRIDVAGWDGQSYALTYSDQGAVAEAIASVSVRDINGTPDSAEIVVRQTSGAQGESVSLWGLRDGEVVPLDAVDGCWDRDNTYGIVGVTLEDYRITATCDGSPDPIVAWPSDVYLWEPEFEAFVYSQTLD